MRIISDKGLKRWMELASRVAANKEMEERYKTEIEASLRRVKPIVEALNKLFERGKKEAKT